MSSGNDKNLADRGEKPLAASKRSEIADFIDTVQKLEPSSPRSQRGRLLFAMDATMSRQPTWDMACGIQGDMFAETADIGGLSVQLAFFRGRGELKASKWVSDPRDLYRVMNAVSCRGGFTQIARMLRHALKEGKKQPVQAIVYVGDCIEENPDELCQLAGELGILKTPLFMFHEGYEPVARAVFQEMARLSGGAFSPFDAASATELCALLRAVAAYAAGGTSALRKKLSTSSVAARLLLEQIKD